MLGSPLAFVVLGELARGGMARVDVARLVGPSRALVAIKRLHGYLAEDDEVVRMFVDEARLLDRLRHPNILKLIGFGRDRDGLFLATELVEGTSLAALERASRKANEPLRSEMIAFLGASIAAGLAAAHELTDDSGRNFGVVHRDVTPDNVLVSFGGDVKVSDFGISKMLFNQTRTTTGVLKGKLRYLSPEYVRGEHIDFQADIFSLGVVLYRLATGFVPFDGSTEHQVIAAICGGHRVPLAEAAPHVDPTLRDLVDRLLSPDAKARAPLGTSALAHELQQWYLSRGFTTAALTRALAALVEQHGASAKTKLALLLESEGHSVASDEGVTEPQLIMPLFVDEPSADAPAAPPESTQLPAAHGTRKVARPTPAFPALPATSTTPSGPEDEPKRATSDGPVAAVTSTPPPPRSRTAYALVFLVTTLAVAAVTFVVKRSASPREPPPAIAASPSATATAPASSSSDAPRATRDVEPAASSSSGASLPATAPLAPGPTPSATPPSSAPSAPAKSRPRVRPPKPRSCTPDDWDYPRCLKP